MSCYLAVGANFSKLIKPITILAHWPLQKRRMVEIFSDSAVCTVTDVQSESVSGRDGDVTNEPLITLRKWSVFADKLVKSFMDEGQSI